MGLTSSGVITTISSVFSLFTDRERKSLPMMGMSPKPISFSAVSVSRLSIRPLIAKLWPGCNSMLVCTLRMVSAGTLNPEMFTPLAKSRALTSGASSR